MPAPKIKLRKISDLKPNPKNARTHSAAQIEQLAASMLEFGFTNPVLYDEDDTLLAGHGRQLAVEKIDAGGGTLRFPGGEPIPAGLIPAIDCSGWSEDQRRAYMLADNQLATQAGWNLDLLNAELDALGAVNFDLTTIGFDQAAIDALQSIGDAGGGTRSGRGDGSIEDSQFQHVDQFAVIVRCVDEREQEARFTELRDKYGAEQVKVVVV